MNLLQAHQLAKTAIVLVTALAATAYGADTAYNGGQPTNPKDLKGKKVVLADVPKLIGIGILAPRLRVSPKAART
jgi:hypothetical protein